MSLFVMSDTHLSLHVDKPMDVFGSRWQNYHERIREEWNGTVSSGDTVVITGDVSWGMNLDEALEDFLFLEELPGYKLLGKGNHDYWWDTVKKMTAFLDSHGIGTLGFLYNNSYDADGITVCGSRGWFNDQKSAPGDSDYAKIVNREALRLELSIADGIKKYNRTPVVFLHFPPVFKNYICTDIIDVLHKYGITRCFYGHIHGVYDTPPSYEYEGITFTITSADYLSFRPLQVMP